MLTFESGGKQTELERRERNDVAIKTMCGGVINVLNVEPCGGKPSQYFNCNIININIITIHEGQGKINNKFGTNRYNADCSDGLVHIAST